MTKYIRLFKKGMYRFCMMFLLILISSGCNVKEIETQTQTETNNQYAVQEPEMTVIDGINYITEQGIKLKVTYPIISKDIADGNLVGTYMVNPVKLGNGLGAVSYTHLNIIIQVNSTLLKTDYIYIFNNTL